MASEIALPASADSDEQLVALWLYGRPDSTRRAYSREAWAFLTWLARPLQTATLAQVQEWLSTFAVCKPATLQRKTAVVKSLLSFGMRVGYLRVNVGSVLALPHVDGILAERILTEEQVHRMLTLTPNDIEATLLRVAYVAGLRVSELVKLRWKDVRQDERGAILSVRGKGGIVRYVRVSRATAFILAGMRPVNEEEAVFPSRRGGGALTTSAIWRIVRRAARRAGIEGNVSPHWLRHAHASHSLARGASIVLVKECLGHANVSTTSRYLHARPDDGSGLYLDL